MTRVGVEEKYLTQVWKISMVLKIAAWGAGKLIGKISDALETGLTEPYAVEVEGKKVGLYFSKPEKVKGKKQIILEVLGDLDDTGMKRLEEDLVRGMVTGYHGILEEQKNTTPTKVDLMGATPGNLNDVQIYGHDVVRAIYEDSDTRKKLSKVIRGVNWETDKNKKLPHVSTQLDNAPLIYSQKGMLGTSTHSIPYQVIHFWGSSHVTPVPGKLVENLYQQRDDKKGKKAAIKEIKAYLKAQKN